MADRDMEIERNMLRSTLAEVLARAEAAEARLAALRQAMEALADEWEPGVWAISNGCAARSLRAVLAEHDTPSDDTAAMSIDPSPPGVTPLPPEQAREILDALDDADTEGVRLTEDERVEVERGYRGNLVDIYAAVERILAARLRAATEGKGEA